MSWNYRVIEDKGEFAIHEVYYNKDGEITNVTVEAIAPVGEKLAELRDEMKHYAEALRHRVLKMSKIKYAPLEDDEK
jgi:hypothetical protein